MNNRVVHKPLYRLFSIIRVNVGGIVCHTNGTKHIYISSLFHNAFCIITLIITPPNALI